MGIILIVVFVHIKKKKKTDFCKGLLPMHTTLKEKEGKKKKHKRNKEEKEHKNVN